MSHPRKDILEGGKGKGARGGEGKEGVGGQLVPAPSFLLSFKPSQLLEFSSTKSALAAMDLEEDDQLFTTFTHKEPFLALLARLLKGSEGEDAEEDRLVAQMGAIVSPSLSLLDFCTSS